MYNIGIDLGGTNIKVGVVKSGDKFEIIGRGNVKTNLPRKGEEIIESIIDAINSACGEAGITLSKAAEIGIGTPGAVDGKSGNVIFSSNFAFRNFELGKKLSEKTGKNVRVGNDANAAAYGEAIAGAGKGYKNVIVITLGTGVGSGIIIDGRIYEGFNFCAGELGHMVIEYDGRACNCGRKGCFEAYSSATALICMTKEAMEADKKSKMWEISASGSNIDGKTAFDGMREGDKTAAQVVETYLSYLGCGLTNIVNTFQPELLLIGGGICREGDYLIKPLRKYIEKEQYSIDGAPKTHIDTAQLGNDAGIIGAAFLHRLQE